LKKHPTAAVAVPEMLVIAIRYDLLIQLNESAVRDHLGEMATSSVEETLSCRLDAEADCLCNAEIYPCGPLPAQASHKSRGGNSQYAQTAAADL